MSFSEIKRQITARLKDVKIKSAKLAAASNYNELQRIITRTIVETAECSSVGELRKIEDYLDAIEICYNNCLTEITGAEREIRLFDFEFEIDEDDEIDGETSENRETRPELKPNIQPNILEIENNFDKYDDECDFRERLKLKSIRKKALKAVRASETRIQLIDATRTYRREYKRFSAMLARKKVYRKAKSIYDEKHINDSFKITNIVRLSVAAAAIISGVIIGFIVGWVTLPQWAFAVMSIGFCYLIIALVVFLADKKRNTKTKRYLIIVRLFCVPAAFILSIIVSIIAKNFEYSASLVATFPFTFCGIAVYTVYRLNLDSIARKLESQNNK